MNEDGRSANFKDILIALALGIGIFILFIVVYELEFSIWDAVVNNGSTTTNGIRFLYNFGIVLDAHLILVTMGFIIFFSLILGDDYLKKRYKPKVAMSLTGLALTIASLYNVLAILVQRYNTQRNDIMIYSFEDTYDYNDFLKGFGTFINGLMTYINSFIFLILAIIIGCVIYQILAALSVELMIRISEKRPSMNRKKIMICAALALIAIIVIPPVIAVTAVKTGWIEKYPDTFQKYPDVGSISWSLNIQRVANDSIIVTNIENNLSYTELEKYLNKDLPFIILIDGINVSNAAAINRSKLNITIDPESGLGIESGQSVSFVGPDINTVDNTYWRYKNLRIFLNYKDEYWTYNDYEFYNFRSEKPVSEKDV